MFSSLRRALGLIKVTEEGSLIHISGLPGDMVRRDIVDSWGTTRIAENMFSYIGSSDVKFNRWFAPDVIYAFQRLISEGSRRHNVRAMKRVVKQMFENTWLKTTTQMQPNILDFSKISLFKFPPLPHQDGFLQTYNWAVPRYHLNGYLLASGPGTGKTFMGLVLGEMLRATAIITVCPKNAVRRVWQNSVSGTGHVEKDRVYKKPHPSWTSLDGTEPPKRGCRHFIVHFDALEKFLQQLSGLPLGRPVILLDESHNLNDDESVRAEAFIKLCKVTRSEHVLWASGTPVKAIGGEVATLFRTVDPLFDEDAQARFKAIYGKASGKANDILAARLGRMAYKIESKAVVKAKGYSHTRSIKIPNGERFTLKAVREEMRKFVEERAEHYRSNMRYYEKQYQAILDRYYRTLPTREQRKEFDQYEDYIKLIRKKYDPVELKTQAIFCNKYEKEKIIPTLSKQDRDVFKNVRSIVKYYKLKVQGEALGQILGRKRAECIIAMVPHIDWEKFIDTALKKTIVFTSYVSVVDAVNDHLKKMGYTSAIVYGNTNSNLAGIVGQFERDQDLNPLIATYASLSTAVPLIMANEMIMLNSPFRSYERDQATARCVRQGQDQDVNIEDVFLDTGDEPNISTRARDILTWSRQQVEEILDFKNPTFAAESADGTTVMVPGVHRLVSLPDQEWLIAMEAELEEYDGFQNIAEWIKRPSWIGSW